MTPEEPQPTVEVVVPVVPVITYTVNGEPSLEIPFTEDQVIEQVTNTNTGTTFYELDNGAIWRQTDLTYDKTDQIAGNDRIEIAADWGRSSTFAYDVALTEDLNTTHLAKLAPRLQEYVAAVPARVIIAGCDLTYVEERTRVGGAFTFDVCIVGGSYMPTPGGIAHSHSDEIQGISRIAISPQLADGSDKSLQVLTHELMHEVDYETRMEVLPGSERTCGATTNGISDADASRLFSGYYSYNENTEEFAVVPYHEMIADMLANYISQDLDWNHIDLYSYLRGAQSGLDNGVLEVMSDAKPTIGTPEQIQYLETMLTDGIDCLIESYNRSLHHH